MSTSTVSSEQSCQEQKSPPTFYVVSMKKMVILTLCTFGFYFTYWNYRNWANYKRATGDSVMPILRAIFAIFFLYPLLKRVDQGLQASGRTYRWSPGLLVLGMLGMLVLTLTVSLVVLQSDWVLVDTPENERRLILLSYLLTLPQVVVQLWLAAQMQRAINTHEGDLVGQGNARLTVANWAWMVIGLLVYWSDLLIVFRVF